MRRTLFIALSVNHVIFNFAHIFFIMTYYISNVKHPIIVIMISIMLSNRCFHLYSWFQRRRKRDEFQELHDQKQEQQAIVCVWLVQVNIRVLLLTGSSLCPPMILHFGLGLDNMMMYISSQRKCLPCIFFDIVYIANS